MPLFSRTSKPGRPAALRRDAAAPSPDAGAAPAQTALLRRYRPLETRARGGFGSVEVCLDTRLMRRVAIKRIPLASPGGGASADVVREALSEARIASMLSHPNIVPVIDFTYDAAYAYLVMEYVDGMSLAEFLQQVDGSSLTYDEAAAVAEALGAALSFAHENGVLHLDIKPANVLIDRKGNVRLTDFGMATLASAAGFGGARGGTVGYMPPEQLAGEVVDERSDVFSLAAVLYESLCATAPFIARTPQESLKLIEKGAPAPADVLPNIPEGAEAALARALEPDPDDRTRSVQDFADEFLDGLGSPLRGRRSLSALIARLASDDEAPEEDEEDAWEPDPALGLLGSRFEHTGRIGLALATAWATYIPSSALLGSLGVDDLPAHVAASLVIAAAAGLAPQMGSALVLAGTLVAMLSGGPLSIVAVPAVALFVLGGTWWFVWGRTDPAASAVMLGVCATGLVAGEPLLLAGPVAAAAAWAASPALAAAGVAAGAVFSQLCSGLEALGFSMAASSVLLRRGARAEGGRAAALVAAGVAVPGIVAAVLACLANPMEIAAGSGARLALAGGLGCASSIIGWILIRMFGYPDSTSGRW